MIGKGIDNILFGMTKAEAYSILGSPDRVYCEYDTINCVYNEKRWVLTFSSEDERLEEVTVGKTDITILDHDFHNNSYEEVLVFLKKYNYTFEEEDYGYFNDIYAEDFIFKFEFGMLTEVALI